MRKQQKTRKTELDAQEKRDFVCVCVYVRERGDWFWFFLYIPSLQDGDLRLLGPPFGRGADGGAHTRDRRVPADLRAKLLAAMPSLSSGRGDDQTSGNTWPEIKSVTTMN
ncbi:hypothetical protein PoB_003645400 [Plakobranchus ocellatus]|uniref:Uncharacterized protein n=1 Tax=Plakobranchus ocellatus TaxID=259542 RepID=A0AAV4AQ90_9GAST|nr:hypothetical protein PoB_003645400 [Plakobranchus ocellatus]